MSSDLIRRIAIKGFRSIRDVTWNPGALNVVIGPNASGKSNLLKVFRLLSAAASGDLQDCIDSEGGMGSILWGSIDPRLSVGITWKEPHGPDPSFAYSLALEPLVTTGSYKIVFEDFQSSEPNLPVSASYTRDDLTFSAEGLSEATSRGFAQAFHGTEPLLSLARSPLVDNNELKHAQKRLASLHILDDFHTDSGAQIRRPVTSRRETRLFANGQNLPEVLHTLYESDFDFKEQIDAAMFAAFPDEYKELAFPPAGERQIQIAVRWKSLNRPEIAAHLSDGALRFLFIIAALSQPAPPMVIAIDEPETGLHPRMMRIIAEYAEDASRNTQVIFTTHSSEFLDVFRTDRPPTVSVTELVNGETQLRVVDPDMLRRWVKGYTLGGLYQSRELEQMPDAEAKEEQPQSEGLAA